MDSLLVTLLVAVWLAFAAFRVAVAWRRVMRDETPLPFFRMVERQGLALERLEETASPETLGIALRRCALCGDKDYCRAWLASPGDRDCSAFCPNVAFFADARLHDAARQRADAVVAMHKTTWVLVLVVLGIAGMALWEWKWDIVPLETWIEDHAVLGALVYVVAVAASVVLLPLSSLPLLPFAAYLYGVVATALLSAGGWWIGSLIAFQIARLGRPYLERVTSLQAVDRLERRIPDDLSFSGIVILRMILPVDIVSFALGLLKELRFSTYAVASLIGILPFAFAWSYAGGELGAGRFATFAAVAVAMTLAVLVLRRFWAARR